MTTQEFAVPRGAGKAFILERGRTVRLTQVEGGGQVVDLTVFNRHNPDERLWGPKTAWEHGLYPAVGAPLLSSGPWEEPLLTLVADTLPREPTARGARFHDLLGGVCSRKSHMRRYGPQETEPGCHELLSEAVAPFGIPPHHVADTFNLFMRTGFSNGYPFHEPSDAAEGDYVELRAEKDVIVAISTCQGRSSKPGSRGVRISIR